MSAPRFIHELVPVLEDLKLAARTLVGQAEAVSYAGSYAQQCGHSGQKLLELAATIEEARAEFNAERERAMNPVTEPDEDDEDEGGPPETDRGGNGEPEPERMFRSAEPVDEPDQAPDEPPPAS